MNRFASTMVTAAVGLCMAGSVLAESATKDECKVKCREAAAMIKKDGIAATKTEIGKKDGKFVWKDSYVFLLTAEGKMLAHPFKPELTQQPSVIGMKDANGKAFIQDILKVAKDPGQGWVHYMWPKPGVEKPAAKMSYIYRVPDTDFVVGAGVYPEDKGK